MITEGMKVNHPDYGIGVVITENGVTADVKFAKHGLIQGIGIGGLRQSINS